MEITAGVLEHFHTCNLKSIMKRTQEPQMLPACLGLSLIKIDSVEAELKSLSQTRTWLCWWGYHSSSSQAAPFASTNSSKTPACKEKEQKHVKVQEMPPACTELSLIKMVQEKNCNMVSQIQILYFLFLFIFWTTLARKRRGTKLLSGHNLSHY